MKDSIALVGMPASGKSTIGRGLARHLQSEFVDVDCEIEHRTGRTVTEIFAEDTEAGFRAIEREVTLDLLGHPGVVALGGGGVLDPDIRSALGDQDAVVWLQISVAKATRRVGMNVMRPLLLGDIRANLQRLYDQREPLYREVATIIVDTEKSTPEELVTEIVARLP